MKHVLVIRLSALGDVAIMAPLVEQYAKGNPDVHFTIAGPPLLSPLFEGMPNVDYLGLKKKQSSVKIFQALEAVGADTVIDLHKVNRVGRALSLLRLRHLFDFRFRMYSLRKGRLSRWLFLHHFNKNPRKSQFERYENVFHRAGLSASCSHHSSFITHHLSPIIGIAPFAQHRGKIWPQDSMRNLVAMLAEKGYEVMLFWK